MTEIINLNKARKARDKARRSTEAARNRVTYGISTRDKRIEMEKTRAADKKLDGHRLESGDKNEKS